MNYMTDGYYHGEAQLEKPQHYPVPLTLHYLYARGKVFYRIYDLRKAAGKYVKFSVKDLDSYEERDYLFSADGLSKNASTYVDAKTLMWRVDHYRPFTLDQKLEIREWVNRLEAEHAPIAAVWEPEPPEAEPPALTNTDQLPTACEQGAQEAQDAELTALKEPKVAKVPEKPKKCQCQGKEKPAVFPSITSGQVAAATQMVEVWKAAGIDNKMIAMALNGFFPNLSLPVGAFTNTDTEYYSANAIAQYVGVYSKKGNPHGGAVAAVIKAFIQPKDDDICKLPFNQNGHSGVCTQYSAAVLAQVEDWFDKEQYPESIGVDGKTYQLCYENP
ncbi:MAG: hypothetical protein LUE89_07455 [Clostridiales bacterium]|nr:hypothetical protein [Clostridiales bacterium]